MKTICSTLAVLILLALSSAPTSAQRPDFSACEDEQGAAKGLCRASIAVGCDVDPNTNSCNAIAEQYQQVTGNYPPFFGPSISPTSGYAGSCYLILDPQGRLELSDLVYFHLPGTEPTSGVAAGVYPDLSEVPVSLGGSVARVPPGSYSVSVLTSGLALKLGPLEFVVTEVPGAPACGR